MGKAEGDRADRQGAPGEDGSAGTVPMSRPSPQGSPVGRPECRSAETSADSSAGHPNGQQATVTVALLPVLRDNYIFVLHDGCQAAVVDPAVAPPVRRWLEERQLDLVAVLQTHHHSDHIGGTLALLERWPGAAVVAARSDRERIPFQTVGVGDGDLVPLLGRQLEVLAVPGHTRAHIAFHLPATEAEGADAGGDLFCGDTLFAGGCGRLFEGTPEQMWQSLQRLAALPGATRVWCAHEYTETNLRWASGERPDDGPIQQRLARVLQTRRSGLPTIPSCIDLERATNLFVRSASSQELARLRESRNAW
jgi:hydroxyacylglutathione hydrolase